MSWRNFTIKNIAKAVFPQIQKHEDIQAFISSMSDEQRLDLSIYKAACKICEDKNQILNFKNINEFIEPAIEDRGLKELKTVDDVNRGIDSLSVTSGIDHNFRFSVVKQIINERNNEPFNDNIL